VTEKSINQEFEGKIESYLLLPSAKLNIQLFFGGKKSIICRQDFSELL
jgi:hypothetical protein